MFKVMFTDKTGQVFKKEFEDFEEAKIYYDDNFYKYPSAELSENDDLIYLWNNAF